MNIFTHLNGMVFIRGGVVVGVALLVISLSQRIVPWLAGRFSGRYRLYILASVPVVRLIVIVLTVWMIITMVIEPTAENIFALLGAFGLALGFAFKDYVSSLIAGIVSLYEAPYRLGDWVSIEEAQGEVSAIGMRSFEIVTQDDTVVVVPHLKLWDRKLFNANGGSRNLQCAAAFYINPRHDPKIVIQALQDTALTSSYLQLVKPISVVALEKPWATQYRLKAYPVDSRDQFRFTTDLTVRGKAALETLGVAYPDMFGEFDHG